MNSSLSLQNYNISFFHFQEFYFYQFQTTYKMSKVTNESFVTLATNDSYSLGALTLAQSLKNVNTNRSLTILITNGVSSVLQ